MALSKYMLQRIIKEDGHLVLTGKETEDDLRKAIFYLYHHNPMECRSYTAGLFVQDAIPDVSVLSPSSLYRHPRADRKKPRPVRDIPPTVYLG